MNLAKIRTHARSGRVRIGTCLGLLFPLLAGPLAYASCPVPPSMKTQLQARPTAESYSSLGSWFGDRKQFDCAADAFASAARLQPDSATLAYMWGLSLYSAGQLQKAADPLRQAARLDPSDIRSYLVLGAVLEQMKQRTDAEVEWRAALAIDPDSETALDNLTRDLIIDKDYSSVLALLGKPARDGKRSSLQNLNLGMAYARTGQLEEASKVLREGLNTAPDSLPLANELSVVLVLLSRVDEAVAVLDLAIERHPDDLGTQLLLLRTLVTNNVASGPQVGQKLLLAYPHNWEVLSLNGTLEIEDGKLQQARSHLEEAVALKPDDSRSHKELGFVLNQLQDLPHAKQQLELAIALGDSEPETQYTLATVLRGLGETEPAQRQFALYQKLKKAESDRKQAAGKAEQADQMLAAGDPVKAAALYREALASDPDEALLAYKLSVALEKTHDFAGEKSALDRAIQLNPNLEEAQNQMGYLAIRSGDASQAENYFRAAIHASPSFITAWINLAATLASEAKWQEAKDALSHALKIDPENAKAHELGQALASAQAQP
jgi:Flp pilus assembly protein TadD